MGVAKYDRPACMAIICERMAAGMSLRQACVGDDLPSKASVLAWVAEDEGFADQYARARAQLLEHWADEIVEIADDGSNDWMEVETRNGTKTVLDHEHIQRSRVRIDTRKWLMSKLAPKVYGDRPAVHIDQSQQLHIGIPEDAMQRLLDDPRALDAAMDEIHGGRVKDVLPKPSSNGHEKNGETNGQP